MTQSIFTGSSRPPIVKQKRFWPSVENINWHFEHDREWNVTYATMSPWSQPGQEWAYGWHREGGWARLGGGGTWG